MNQLDRYRMNLQARCQQRLAQIRSTERTDRAAATANIHHLYRWVDRPEPVIVWCDSPWQCRLMSLLFEGVLTESQLETLETASMSPTTAPASGIVVGSTVKEQWQALRNRFAQQGGLIDCVDTTNPAFYVEKRDDRPNPMTGTPVLDQLIKKARLPDPRGPWKHLGGYRADPILELWVKLMSQWDVWCLKNKTDEVYNLLRRDFESSFCAPYSFLVDAHISNATITELEETFQISLDLENFGTGPIDTALENWLHFKLPSSGKLSILHMLCTDELSDFEVTSIDELSKIVLQDPFLLELGMRLRRIPPYWSVLDPWMTFVDFLADVGLYSDASALNKEFLHVFMEVQRHIHCSFLCEGICYVSDRPIILECDERGNIHSSTGPALAYADGIQVYALHGVTVSPDQIEGRGIKSD